LPVPHVRARKRQDKRRKSPARGKSLTTLGLLVKHVNPALDPPREGYASGPRAGDQDRGADGSGTLDPAARGPGPCGVVRGIATRSGPDRAACARASRLGRRGGRGSAARRGMHIGQPTSMADGRRFGRVG
jgi:hypothetical protein